MTEKKYKAFISYSHADEQAASWLHKGLERYRVPRRLVAAHGLPSNRLLPIFRDRDELSTSSSLSGTIESALHASENLIVICSPAAVASRWVNEEIKAFKALGRDTRIFCLIIDGKDGECFPAALVDDEPLGADIRPGGDGKQDAKLKLIAGVLDIGFGELKDREQRRRTRFTSIAVAASLLIAGIMTALAIKSVIAEREAEQSRIVATEALADAELVAEFLSGMLKELNPEAMGNSIVENLQTQAGDIALPEDLNGTNTARLLLDEHLLQGAVQSVSSQFADRPKISGRLERAIGDSYQSIGLYEEAVELQTAAWQNYQKAYGERDARTINTRAAVGQAYLYNGQMEASLSAFRDAVNWGTDALGADHEVVLSSQNGLAMAYTDLERTEEARDILMSLVATLNTTLGPEAEYTMAATGNLGWTLYANGEYDRAIAILDELLAVGRRVAGPEDPFTLGVLNNLALAYRQTGRYTEAIAAHREEWEISKRVMGDNHPEVLVSQLNLSRALLASDQTAEADETLSDALIRVDDALPPVHPLTAAMLVLHGEIKLAAGEPGAARRMLLRARSIYVEIFGADSPRVDKVDGLLARTE